MGGAEIDDQHLVFGVVNDDGQVQPQLRELRRVELAEENGELHMVATSFEVVEDFGPPIIVGDVVGDDVMTPGGHRVVMLV